jgi:flavin reductase (DIM6/NTAB) family NADH-FMN oxidoreductase RutF
MAIVELSTAAPVWDRFFTVAPIVLVATRDADGGHDIAPKHMAMPLGWDNFFCFACTPAHATWRNARASGAFTVSFPAPEQVLGVTMAAGGRMRDGAKPTLAALPTRAATAVDGVLVEGALVWLECELERIVDGFGQNSLVVGRVVAASADERAVRDPDVDDAELLRAAPPMAYLSPGRFAAVGDSNALPFPSDFRR